MADHKPPRSSGEQREQSGQPDPQQGTSDKAPSAKKEEPSVRERMRKKAEKRHDRRAVAPSVAAVPPLPAVEETVNTLGAMETSDGSKSKTRKIDSSSSSGGVLQAVGEQQKPVITLEEIEGARPEIEERQALVVARVQKLLDSLAGRRCRSEQESKEVARLVYHIARDSGCALLCDGQAGDIIWQAGVFEIRTTDSRRLSLYRSAEFPSLIAKGKKRVENAHLRGK